uniref:Uncharacterized protein n=1 Tax=Myotis myotis TaxID=51298 RepID=A0A7J7RH13_MYOMY|nr:hypothetical protein mMyoMyo1_010327 [Myotis myotis]
MADPATREQIGKCGEERFPARRRRTEVRGAERNGCGGSLCYVDNSPLGRPRLLCAQCRFRRHPCSSVGVGATESRPWGAAAQAHPPPWQGVQVGLEVSAVHKTRGLRSVAWGSHPSQHRAWAGP